MIHPCPSWLVGSEKHVVLRTADGEKQPVVIPARHSSILLLLSSTSGRQLLNLGSRSRTDRQDNRQAGRRGRPYVCWKERCGMETWCSKRKTVVKGLMKLKLAKKITKSDDQKIQHYTVRSNFYQVLHFKFLLPFVLPYFLFVFIILCQICEK